jgi:hypothetical protein
MIKIILQFKQRVLLNLYHACVYETYGPRIKLFQDNADSEFRVYDGSRVF